VLDGSPRGGDARDPGFGVGAGRRDDGEEGVGVDLTHAAELRRLVFLAILDDAERVNPDVADPQGFGQGQIVVDGLCESSGQRPRSVQVGVV